MQDVTIEENWVKDTQDPLYPFFQLMNLLAFEYMCVYILIYTYI